MFSREGERVVLEKPVDATGNVETWLQRLVEGMQASAAHAAQGPVHGTAHRSVMHNEGATITGIGQYQSISTLAPEPSHWRLAVAEMLSGSGRRAR
jgi:hypothetical protein